jgi:hypothetical protein
MSQNSSAPAGKPPAEKVVRDIRRATRKRPRTRSASSSKACAAKASVAALGRREAIAESLYYVWSKEFLETRRIRRMPVLRRQQLVGVVSRADLLRAVMTPVAAGAAEDASDPRIRRERLARMTTEAWVSTRFVFPVVKNGVVTFRGFASAEVATALRVLAEGVPGGEASGV